MAIETRGRNIHSGSPTRQDTNIGWMPPPPGYTKVNLDGAVDRARGTTSIAAVTRDGLGRILAGLAIPTVCRANSEMAEMMGLRTAVNMARDKGWTKVIFETDSKLIYDKFNDPRGDQTTSGTYIEQIREDCISFESCMVVHVKRELNVIAHKLAKWTGSSFVSLFFDEDCPEFIRSDVMTDVSRCL